MWLKHLNRVHGILLCLIAFGFSSCLDLSLVDDSPPKKSPIVIITTNEGEDFTTNQSEVLLKGIAYNTTLLKMNSTDTIDLFETPIQKITQWERTVTLGEGDNLLAFSAYDKDNQQRHSEKITITRDSTTEASPLLFNEGHTKISAYFFWTPKNTYSDMMIKVRYVFYVSGQSVSGQSAREIGVVKGQTDNFVHALSKDSSVSGNTKVSFDIYLWQEFNDDYIYIYDEPTRQIGSTSLTFDVPDDTCLVDSQKVKIDSNVLTVYLHVEDEDGC